MMRMLDDRVCLKMLRVSVCVYGITTTTEMIVCVCACVVVTGRRGRGGLRREQAHTYTYPFTLLPASDCAAAAEEIEEKPVASDESDKSVAQ